MAIPATAKALPVAIDPQDIRICGIDIPRGTTPTDLLRPTETISSFTLVATAAAIEMGLIIRQDASYAPVLVGDQVRFHVSVEPTKQGDPLFNDPGFEVAIELTGDTSANPPQRFNRTTKVRILSQ